MSVLCQPSFPSPPGPLVITIGVFDGVHLGHRHLLGRLAEIAAQRNCQPGAITFDNHPRSVLYPGVHISYLCTLEERIQLLRQAGVAYVAPITFTPELSELPPREFLEWLRHRLDLRGLVVGPDFALGHHREGTVPVLQELGRELGFSVETVGLLRQGSQVVTSTAIRQALAQGDVVAASRLLGRPFRLRGRVVAGDGKGRELGFPTANVEAPQGLALPADGIYATLLHIGGQRLKSATNIGVRPTFGPGLYRTVEAFILDFQGDLYTRDVSLEFIQRLRDEVAFPSADALVQQMHRDVEHARKVLEAVPGG